jgi:hypothetical protein
MLISTTMTVTPKFQKIVHLEKKKTGLWKLQTKTRQKSEVVWFGSVQPGTGADCGSRATKHSLHTGG